jgi:hypothetical protein
MAPEPSQGLCLALGMDRSDRPWSPSARVTDGLVRMTPRAWRNCVHSLPISGGTLEAENGHQPKLMTVPRNTYFDASSSHAKSPVKRISLLIVVLACTHSASAASAALACSSDSHWLIDTTVASWNMTP